MGVLELVWYIKIIKGDRSNTKGKGNSRHTRTACRISYNVLVLVMLIFENVHISLFVCIVSCIVYCILLVFSLAL